MSGTGLLRTPPERLREITCGALERRLTSQVPRELDWTATNLLRATVGIVPYKAAHPGIADEPLRAVMSTAHDKEQEVDP